MSKEYFTKKFQQQFVIDFRKRYKSFDEKSIINDLTRGYQLFPVFHLKVPTEIRYIARKHRLIKDKWDQIYQDLLEKNVGDGTKLLLTQAMKYAVKKGTIDIDLEKLLIILQENRDTQIKSEIVWILSYQLQNFFLVDYRIDEQLLLKINSNIEGSENELDSASISFLNEQIQRQYHVNRENCQQVPRGKIKTSPNYLTKMPQITVTKNQQTTRIKNKSIQSEESVNRLNSVNVFKNMNRKIKMNCNTENLPTIPDKDEDGSDTSIFRDTYDEVVHLYNRIKSGQTLKKNDKDKYLPSKFIGPWKKWQPVTTMIASTTAPVFLFRRQRLRDIYSIVQPLFIDRMIAVIFLEISKTQILHENVIKVLMDCVDTLDQVEEKVLGGTTKKKKAAEKIALYNRRKKFLGKIGTLVYAPLHKFNNAPYVVATVAHKINEEYIEDSKEIEKILSSEINQIRLAAISAIYNCAIRNSAILNKERLENIRKCLTDNDIEFHKFVIKILSTLEEINKNLFENCLENLEKHVNIDDSINYIHQQSIDERRCKELFNEDVISMISSLLRETALNKEAKTICCEIINNYLEHSYSKGLNRQQLENYVDFINNPKNGGDLKLETLKSIVLTVEKNKGLPGFVIQTLVKKINNSDDKFDNFVVVALGIVSQWQAILEVDKLSTKLLDDWVIVGEGADISFEKSSKTNSDCQSISSIVAQIFVRSLQKNVRITDQSLEYLAKALTSNDKQTCILSARSLYLASETHDIKNEVLVELREYVEDRIPDVSVYSTVVYARSLRKLSEKEPIMASHIGFLPTIYVFEDLKLGEESFVDVVNKNILIVLNNESKTKQFEDHVFQIFDHILLFENRNQVETIEILHNYSANQYPIPENTLFALENVVGIPEFCNQALKVFENIIKNRQIVNEKILHIIADKLYLSDDNKLRDESFRLLDIANNNQDISDEIFDILELERASLAISSFLPDSNDAMSYLQEKTKEGGRLTVNGFRALSEATIYQSRLNEEILRILLNISNNGQMIPNDLINKLVRGFDPKQVQYHLIEIFENLVKNNQNISNELSFKLGEALDNPHIYDQVLFIFLLQGQKGKKLPERIIREILKKFLNLENSLIMQQYLPVICSLIEKKNYFEYNSESLSGTIDDQFVRTNLIPHIQTVLIHALKIGSQEIVRKSVEGFKMLISLHKAELEKQSIEALLSLATKAMCDDNVKQEINMILHVSQLEESQECIRKLCNLKYNSNDQLLDILAEFDKPKLLQQNFYQINFIIDNFPELHSKALETLLQCSNKEDIPDKLLNSIGVLLASTTSQTIRLSCCRLIAEIAEAGRKVTDQIISIIVTQAEKQGLRDILKSISKNQLISKELQDRIHLFSQINRTMRMDPTSLSEFLNRIQQELQEGLKLSNQSIEKLLSIIIPTNANQNDFKIKLEQELVDIYALILIQNPDYPLNPLIVDSLEKAILSETINKNILNAYQEVIKITECRTDKCLNVLNAFIDILDNNDKYVQFHFDILVCVALASKFIKISKLEPLEINLFSDDEIVRYWSFRGLRAASENDYESVIFREWCSNVIVNLEDNIDTQVDLDLDLFETIAVLKYVDFDKIHDKPQSQWNRELLIFDLIERCQISEGERFHFYKTWLEIEEHEEFQKGKSDILLKLLHSILLNNIMTCNQCYDTIKILDRIDFEDARHVLSNSKNPYLDLQKKYLAKFIYQRLLNKKDISSKYIDDLASNMISKFGLDVSHKLLDAIKNIDCLREFENILNFAQENKIKISDIYVKETTISILKRSLEIKFLGNQIVKTDRSKFALHLDNLLDKNWTFEQLNAIFSNLEASNNVEKRVKEKNFVYVLEILSQYKIPSTPKNHKEILLALEKPAESWLREVNKIAVETNFSEIGEVRNAAELIEELGNSNSYNRDLTSFIRINLLNLIEKIKSSDLISQVLDNTAKDKYDRKMREQPIYITQLAKEQIRQWANTVKANDHACSSTEDFTVEALAVIKQANFLDTGYHLTDAQILSCLIALNANSNKGRLLQVGTGEGKSTIISVLAVVYALKGKTVDIITSSPVLAERDAKEKAKFYSMFDLQCSDNNDKSLYLTGPKACYKKQIVYGEATQFQFDTLRTEYAQLNTLSGRKCEVALVDEVDSMLIDDSSKIARLATAISGMDQLQIIYHFLWHQLVSLQDKIIMLNNKMYLLYTQPSFEQEKITLEYIDEQGQIIKIDDLKSYTKSNSDISHIGQSLPENVETDIFIKKNLEDYIRTLIGKNIKIPKNFEDFVHSQIPKWVDNAMIAFYYQENVHYVIHEGLIKPVDYYSTGIVQSSSNWSDGLHQFLQLKHNLKMTSETFTTNFLSNIGYFTRYGQNLFGLTGTLGSEKAKQVLVDVYKVDLVVIPNSRRKQYIAFPDIVTMNESDWLEEICRSVINESIKGRGSLVICETIEHSIVIAEKLRHKHRSNAIKLYTMNNMDQEKHIQTINSGEIIIATNLAGRGTDIKTDEIEKNGGLHVIITFMPSNKRVEEQAFGRTARQGKRGTGQKIINATNFIQYEGFDTQKITEVRDTTEANMLKNFQECDLKVIRLKDELFVKFCSLLNEIRQKIRKKISQFTPVKNQVKSVFTNITPSVYESNVLLSIEEQWAMFLRKIDYQKFSIDIEKFPEECKKFHEEYRKFEDRIQVDYENDCVIKNPYYHIVVANDLVIHDSSLKDLYDKTMKHFDRAIELDPKHSATAFAGRGWLLLKGKERFFRAKKQNLGYKEAAISEFNKALEILSEEMAVLISMQTLLQLRCPNINTALSKQLIQKVNILGTYCNSLENAVTVTKKSQRLIQVTEILDYSHRNNSGVSKEIISYDGIKKGSGKLCDIRLMSYDDIYHHIDAIENREEIAVMKENENQFAVIYKQKGGNMLATWMVDNQDLSNYLSSLHCDETILDRNEHSEIYNIIYEQITSNDGDIRDVLALRRNLTANGEYEVIFNDLTVRQDIETIDQAIEIINYAVLGNEQYWSPILHSNYKGISVSITQINAERLKAFLNPNIEIKEATKEVALAQLRDKSTFFHRHLLPESWSPDSCSVDLEILLHNNKIGMKSVLQARRAIEIVQKQTEDNVQFNLTFISANEISKVLKKEVLPHSNQTVEFIGLNGENVKKKLRNIVSKSITLEISDNKEKLLEVLSSLDKEYVELYSYEKEKQNHGNMKVIVDKFAAKRKIEDIPNDSTTIRLINVTKSTVEKIINTCPTANFNINFISVNFESLLKELKDEQVSIHFDELEKKAATELITQSRKENFDFTLIFKSLKTDQVRRLIEETPIEQENIEINKVKTLSDLFMNESIPHVELSEFAGRGIEYLLEINEKRFIPWRSIGVVVTIAAVQMAVGGILIGSGFGATVGMGLITEGGADLFMAHRVYSTRQFSWSDYGKQKAVSLIISAVSMGFSAIKDAGKGAQTLVTGVAEEVLERAGTKVITDGKAVGQVLATTGKNLKTLAIKQIGVTVGENALREGLNKVADLSSNFVLEQLKPQVSASIQSKVSSKFSEPNLLKIVRKMYAIDSLNKQQQFKGKINKIVAEIINPEHNFWRKQWDSIGGSLCKGILSSVQHIGGPFSMGMRILGTLNGMYEITFIIDKVHDELLKRLSELDQETLSMDQILHRCCEVKKEDTNEIVSLLQKQGIIGLNKEVDNQNFSKNLGDTDFGKFKEYKEKTVNFLQSLHTNMLSVEFNDLSEIIKLVSDMITEQVFRITESQLISPWSSYGMGKLTQAVSERVQHHCIVDEKQNSDSQNREDQEKGGSKYNTIAKQINYNARDYTIAYSQCEISYHSQQQHQDRTHHEKIDTKTKEYADNIRKDKPALPSDIIALADKHGLDVKLVDDPKYQPTEEDKVKGIHIVVYTKGEIDNQGKNIIGHFQLMSSDGTVINTPSENNNCGYVVIQKILNAQGIDKSIEDLRNDRAQIIEDNPQTFAKVLKAQEWIETRYPKEANSLLMRGSGKRKNNKSNNPENNRLETKMIKNIEVGLYKPSGDNDLCSNPSKAIEEQINRLIDIIPFDKIEHNEKGTILGYGIQHSFNRGDGEIGVEDFWKEVKGGMPKRGKNIPNSHSIRLDIQNKPSDGRVNLQIQHGTNSYANVILPLNYEIGKEALREMFRESFRTKLRVEVPLKSKPS